MSQLSLLLLSYIFLGCMTLDDLHICPGKSLLQTSAHRNSERSVEVENAAAATDSYQTSSNVAESEGFRLTMGELFLILIGFMLLIGAYFCLKPASGKKNKKEAPTRPRTSEDAQSDASSSGDNHPDVAGSVERTWSQKKSAEFKFDHETSIAAYAFTEESDGEDFQLVGTDDVPVEREYNPMGIPLYIENHFRSWALLIQILGALAQFWGALGFMYWSLLYSTDELMDCEGYRPDEPHFTLVTHACHYTLACLRGFPILAANMILVLMVRTLMQTRIYYSMLREGYLVVFQNVPVMNTIWPWVIAISMLQGGLHFVLKAVFHPESHTVVMWLRLVRKFVLPGSIFFSMLSRYADVENTLVPLNHIAELEHTMEQDFSPWLANMKILNERVLAFDVRHRDVYEDTLADIGRSPTLKDIILNVIKNYGNAQGVWHTRMHRSWGLFRSLWPASLLLDHRLDTSDPDTHTWLLVCFILLSGCVITSLLSVYIFLSATSPDTWHLFARNIKSTFTHEAYEASPTTLGNLVTIIHAVAVVVLLVSTIHNMFYFCFTPDEVQRAMKKVVTGDALYDALDLPTEERDARRLKEALAESEKNTGFKGEVSRSKSSPTGFFGAMSESVSDATASLEGM